MLERALSWTHLAQFLSSMTGHGWTLRSPPPASHREYDGSRVPRTRQPFRVFTKRRQRGVSTPSRREGLASSRGAASPRPPQSPPPRSLFLPHRAGLNDDVAAWRLRVCQPAPSPAQAAAKRPTPSPPPPPPHDDALPRCRCRCRCCGRAPPATATTGPIGGAPGHLAGRGGRVCRASAAALLVVSGWAPCGRGVRFPSGTLPCGWAIVASRRCRQPTLPWHARWACQLLCTSPLPPPPSPPPPVSFPDRRLLPACASRASPAPDFLPDLPSLCCFLPPPSPTLAAIHPPRGGGQRWTGCAPCWARRPSPAGCLLPAAAAAVGWVVAAGTAGGGHPPRSRR